MNFNDLSLAANFRREQLLREAEKQRHSREAQRTQSESIPAQLLRVVVAILLIRPF
jgi:hypothetical protein